jgi:hypothetical protein
LIFPAICPSQLMVYTKPLKKSKPVKITKVGQHAPKSTHPQLVTTRSLLQKKISLAPGGSACSEIYWRAAACSWPTPKKDDAPNLVYKRGVSIRRNVSKFILPLT